MAKNVKINSVVYAEVPQVSIPLAEGEGAATFYDTTGATAVSADILNGKTAFLGTGSGSMPDNGAVSGSIGKVDGSYTIPAGYTIMAKAQLPSRARNKPSWSRITSRQV